MTVTRYDPALAENFGEPYAAMDKHSQGDYVEYSDYEDLASDYERLKDRYGKLLGKLVDLYQEG